MAKVWAPFNAMPALTYCQAPVATVNVPAKLKVLPPIVLSLISTKEPSFAGTVIPPTVNAVKSLVEKLFEVFQKVSSPVVVELVGAVPVQFPEVLHVAGVPEVPTPIQVAWPKRPVALMTNPRLR